MRRTRTRIWVLAAAVVVALVAWWALRGSPLAEEPAAAPFPAQAALASSSSDAPARGALSTGPPSAVPGWFGQPEAPARRIAGRVTFEGQPVSGALVRLATWPRPLNVAALELRSSANGTFDFGLRPSLRHTVSAAAPGRTEAVLVADLQDPGARPAPEALELVLTSCDARLVGHVFDSGGGAIEHARIHRGSVPQAGRAQPARRRLQ